MEKKEWMLRQRLGSGGWLLIAVCVGTCWQLLVVVDVVGH